MIWLIKDNETLRFSRLYLVYRKQYLVENKGWMPGERKFLVTKMLL